jgi:hypothetical protein
MEVSTFGIWWRVTLTFNIWLAFIEAVSSKPLKFWLDVWPFFVMAGLWLLVTVVQFCIWRGIGATFQYVSKDA